MDTSCRLRSPALPSRFRSATLVLLGAVAFLGPTPTPVPAQTSCVVYSDYIRLLGQSGPLTDGWDVALADGYAYVADGSSGVRVFDVSNTSQPSLIRTITLPFGCTAIDAKDGLLFAAYGGGFRIYDLANAADPALVSSMYLPGLIVAIVARGARVYTASEVWGLSIVDVSDPTAPYLVGTLDTPGVSSGLALDGLRVLIAAGSTGLFVVDISDEETPVVTATVDTPGTASRVAVHGEIAYVADWASGVKIVALDATPPSVVGTIATRGGRDAYEVVVHGSRLLVINDELRTFDISVPASPVEIGSLHVWGRTIAVSDQWAAVVWDLGLFTVALDNPSSPPVVLAAFDPPDMHWSDLDLQGDHAYVASGPEGVRVLDISDPSQPRIVGAAAPIRQANSIAVRGERLYVGDLGGFQVFDCTDPASLQLLSTLPGRWTQGIAVRDDYVFAGLSPQGLVVVDVHDPALPSIAMTMPEIQLGDVAIVGTTLFVADYVSGIITFDIADPANPIRLGQLNPWPGAAKVAINGNFAYVAHHEFMSIVRIADPRHPTLVDQIPALDLATDVAVGNGYAYVATRMGGVQVVDVRHPTAAHTVGWHDGPQFALGVALHGDHLWVTGDVLDVIPTQCRPVALAVSGLSGVYESGTVRLSWTSAPEQGFRVFRSGPGSTKDEVVGETRSNGAGEAIFVDMPSRSAVFRYGLGSLLDDESDPSLGAVLVTVPPNNIPELLLAEPMPNPTESRSRCLFTLRAPGHVRVGIYDAGGRLVRTLLNERREAGEHAVVWDGHDSSGKTAAAGVYFLDIAAGRRSETRKVVLQK